MTIPIPIRLLEAAPSDTAIGIAPKASVKLVIKIGRSRDSEALMMASYFERPCSLS